MADAIVTQNPASQKYTTSAFEPVTLSDINNTTSLAFGYAEAGRALFEAISRLSDDRVIKALCENGMLQMDFQANDLDCLRENAIKGGVIAAKATPLNFVNIRGGVS